MRYLILFSLLLASLLGGCLQSTTPAGNDNTNTCDHYNKKDTFLSGQPSPEIIIGEFGKNIFYDATDHLFYVIRGRDTVYYSFSPDSSLTQSFEWYLGAQGDFTKNEYKTKSMLYISKNLIGILSAYPRTCGDTVITIEAYGFNYAKYFKDPRRGWGIYKDSVSSGKIFRSYGMGSFSHVASGWYGDSALLKYDDSCRMETLWERSENHVSMDTRYLAFDSSYQTDTWVTVFYQNKSIIFSSAKFEGREEWCADGASSSPLKCSIFGASRKAALIDSMNHVSVNGNALSCKLKDGW